MTSPAAAGPPRAWPLVLTGVLGFLPIVGIPFGFVASVWGLLSDRPRALMGAAIGAAGVLCNFAACGLIGVWTVRQEPGGLGGALAREELSQVVRQLEGYRRDNPRYPSTLRDLRSGPFGTPPGNIYDRTVSLFNRSTTYQYHPTADGQAYRLFAVGPDGIAGTADDVYPPPDSLASASGLLPPPTR